MKVPVTKPFLDARDAEALLRPLSTGWLVQGPEVAEFERRFAAYVGAGHARASTSCTTALHLALEALGIGSGDRVIVPAFTYVASANAVEYAGAEVVFCDVEPETFNIDVRSMERILAADRERRIRAVMPVNLFGLCADLPAVLELAKAFGLKVVEDSACGFGARIGGRHSGTFGDAGCFSFHPRKSITTGEGGMVVTDDPEIAGRIAILRDHGAARSDLARHGAKGAALLPSFDVRGYNYRMTDFQGALGIAQLEKGDGILARKREIARRYDALLSGLPALAAPFVPEGYVHGYQSYVCRLVGGTAAGRPGPEEVENLSARRARIMAVLEERGIATRQGTHAVHALGYYRRRYGLREEDFPAAYAADRLSLSLPLYAAMTEGEFDHVAASLTEVLR